MTISEEQLTIWARQGAVVASRDTYAAIDRALNGPSSKIKDRDFELYLQGSYRNTTNIRGDSDIDVVAEMKSVFFNNLKELPGPQQSFVEGQFYDSPYTWWQFRQDTYDSLCAYFGRENVKFGSKSIKVSKVGSLLAADVVPCFEYRHYQYYYGDDLQSFTEGIRFINTDTLSPITNYPRLHYDNGVGKNEFARTRGLYKPLVRIIKNSRLQAVSAGILKPGITPSYFIECLLYNVPDFCYTGTYQESYVNAVNWLNANLSPDFVCQNEIHPLFGDEPTQWDMYSARMAINALIENWKG